LLSPIGVQLSRHQPFRLRLWLDRPGGLDKLLKLLIQLTSQVLFRDDLRGHVELSSTLTACEELGVIVMPLGLSAQISEPSLQNRAGV
jgi:hypothetical protein